MKTIVVIFIVILAGISCTAGQLYTDPYTRINKGSSESMMGSWHLPGGDINISTDDVDQMIGRLQYFYPDREQDGYVMPVELFMYGL
jgi:hypothetical protein